MAENAEIYFVQSISWISHYCPDICGNQGTVRFRTKVKSWRWYNSYIEDHFSEDLSLEKLCGGVLHKQILPDP